MSEVLSQVAGVWQNRLPEETAAYLADLLDDVPAAPDAAAGAAPVILSGAPAPAPRDAAELIATATADRLGLVSVAVAERPHPLWLRAGTTDPAIARRSLDLPATGLHLPYEPKRILELGAGVGLRTVALALAYPGADILTTDSDPACQRAGLLNTLPYRNIVANFTAVSTSAGRYGFSGRAGEGGRPVLAQEEQGTIVAQALGSFLQARGFGGFETVVITPDAATDHLLRAPWPNTVRLIAIENGGQPLHEATASCFPDSHFLTEYAGDYVLLHRRMPAFIAIPARAVPIFGQDGPVQPLSFSHIHPSEGGFFTFSPAGLRLHANTSPGPVASVSVPFFCRNHNELHLILRNPLGISAPLRFTVRIETPDGVEICGVTETVRGGATRPLIAAVTPYTGPSTVTFSTEMAEFGTSNAGAWGEFAAASLV
jgi:hypothetical protein